MEQRVVCAAIRNRKTGKILCGARHYDSIMLQHIRMDVDKTWKDAEQGFIDQFGKYLDRREAWEIARKNDQIIRKLCVECGILFSENLY